MRIEKLIERLTAENKILRQIVEDDRSVSADVLIAKVSGSPEPHSLLPEFDEPITTRSFSIAGADGRLKGRDEIWAADGDTMLYAREYDQFIYGDPS